MALESTRYNTARFGRFTILASVLLICLSGTSQNLSTANGHSVDFLSGQSIHKDLDTLKKWIEEMHPSPFARCTEQDWNDAYTAGNAMYNGGGTHLAAAQVFSRLTNVLKDSHTCVSLKSLSDSMREKHGVLPFEITTIQNRIYAADDGNGSIETGAEIIGINGQSARMVLGTALQLVPLEGEAPIARLRLAEKFWNDLATMMIQSSPSDTLRVQLGGLTDEHIEHPVTITRDHSSKQEPKRNKSIEWKFIDHEVACLTISSFQPNRNRQFERSLRQGFRTLKKRSRDELNSPISLLIDIRGNAGGNVALMELLLPYLTSSPVYLPHAVSIRQSAFTKTLHRKNGFALPLRRDSKHLEMTRFSKAMRETPVGSTVEILFDIPSHPHKRLNYAGKTALLMDGLSASASVAFASWFIQSGRGSTFGESPMGSASGTFGNPVKRVLPHTGLTVNIATAQYFSSSSHAWDSKPILPDFPISWSELDLQKGDDPVLKAAYQWLRNTQ